MPLFHSEKSPHQADPEHVRIGLQRSEIIERARIVARQHAVVQPVIVHEAPAVQPASDMDDIRRRVEAARGEDDYAAAA